MLSKKNLLSFFVLSFYFLTIVSPTQAAIRYPFRTLPPGAKLPTDQECADIVKQKSDSSFEPRADNTTYNQINVYQEGYRFPPDELAGLGTRVTGNFTGTTDQIFQWAACKWGFDVDTVRAQAVQESDWHQSTLGDCDQNQNTQPDTNHCASMGILQVKGADLPPDQPFTYPYAKLSTSFNVDYTLAVRRQCYEGKIDWLNDRDVRKENGKRYTKGDEWGCMGFWYSGRWYDQEAKKYLNKKSELGDGVRNIYNKKPWKKLNF